MDITKTVISETYDPGSIAFYGIFTIKTFCNFYDFESDKRPCENYSLEEKIHDNTYIVIPSERVMQSRLSNPKRFPKGHIFYTSLFVKNGRYTQHYKTPCDLFCKILYLGDPLTLYEQTAYVFDRPTVYVFEKI